MSSPKNSSRFSDLQAKLADRTIVLPRDLPHDHSHGMQHDFVSFDEVAQMHDHQMDALRYAMQALVKSQVEVEEEQIKAALVKAGIPLPDPSWPPEQQKAHLALHCPPDFKVAVPRTLGAMPANLPQTSPELLKKMKDALAALPPAPLPGIRGMYRPRW